MAAKRLIGERRMTGQEARARWVAANPQKTLEVNRNSRRRKVAKINQHKANRGCEDCGNNDPRVLDLHHRDASEKEYTIANMKMKVGWARLQEEVAKCDVLCANCHRIRHATEPDSGADIQMTTGVFFRAI